MCFKLKLPIGKTAWMKFLDIGVGDGICIVILKSEDTMQ